jgi:hypothetical protein
MNNGRHQLREILETFSLSLVQESPHSFTIEGRYHLFGWQRTENVFGAGISCKPERAIPVEDRRDLFEAIRLQDQRMGKEISWAAILVRAIRLAAQ